MNEEVSITRLRSISPMIDRTEIATKPTAIAASMFSSRARPFPEFAILLGYLSQRVGKMEVQHMEVYECQPAK